MKLLKIENNQGLYLVNDNDYAFLDKITKDDLMRLAEHSLNDDATFDEFDEGLIKNEAHKIIYKSVYDKLKELSERKNEFRDEYERQYLKEYEKYCTVPSTR